MPPLFEIVLTAIFFIWLLVLTVLFYRLQNHYNAITRGSHQRNLQTILDSILKELEVAKKDIANLTAKCDKIEKDGMLHIQKIGLLRFNPFKDTGGDQSFILALVDATNTGVVISGLYSRSGTRWYAKKVVAGKGIEHELSQDEKKALDMAKTIGK